MYGQQNIKHMNTVRANCSDFGFIAGGAYSNNWT